MANLRLIKRRIKSVQNISQITKAMQMVAASKMKKAQETAVMGKPYAEKIYQVIQELSSKVDKSVHPLLSSGNPGGKTLIVIISTNKGLCGSLNTNLFRKILNFLKETNKYDFVTIGKKGQQFIIKSKKDLVADFSEKSGVVEIVPSLTKIIVDGFKNGIYSEIYLIFNTFISVLKQQPNIKRILPITSLDLPNELDNKSLSNDILIEPNVDEMLDFLLPHYLENQVRAAIFESIASEHSARMIAMKNATDAALDFMDALTLVYNKARQEKITYEIADIVTAKIALD